MKNLADNSAAHARRLKAVEAIACMGMTKAQAAEYSGLSVGGINNMLQDERVQKYIERLRKSQDKRAQITRDEVVIGVKDAIDRAKRLGEPRTEIAGWETLIRMQGLNAPERMVVELPEETREMLDTLKGMDSAQVAELAGTGNIIDLDPEDFDHVDDEDGDG